jgi:AcrR family transcriptional regulator
MSRPATSSVPSAPTIAPISITDVQAAPARRYRGVSQEERRESRRRSLILAAIKVYGESGFRAASIKAVCAEAGLTERYFYESFGNGEDLLLAAYHAVIEGLLVELAEAAAHVQGGRTERARVMLHAYFSLLQREPAAARLILIEIRGVSEAATDAYTAALRSIAQRLAGAFAIGNDATDQLLALGVVGGISLTALHWIQQGHTPGIDVMVDVALKLARGLLGEG